jgi:hypothetical protein
MYIYIHVGEASPAYFTCTSAAGNIKAVFPEAKIIASVREPVERIYSRITHMARIRCEQVRGFHLRGLDICMHTPCVHTYIHTYIHTYTHIYIYIYIYIYIHTCIYPYTPTYMHSAYVNYTPTPRLASYIIHHTTHTMHTGSEPKFLSFDRIDGRFIRFQRGAVDAALEQV